MASISDITAELADAESLLKGVDFSQEVKLNIVKQLAAKVHGLKALLPMHAQQFMSALKAIGLAKDLSDILDTAINVRLLKPSAGSSSRSESPSGQQLLTHPLRYLTKSDWAQLNAPDALPSKMAWVISNRYALLGIRSFHEETYRWSITIILSKVIAQSGQWPKYRVIFNWLADFKRDFTSFKTPWAHEVLLKYPPTPDLLPKPIFDNAYPDPEDPPVEVEIGNFCNLGAHVPLRNNNKLLAQEREAEARLNMQTMGMGAPGGFQMDSDQFMKWLRQHSSTQVPIPGIQYFGAAAGQRPPPALRMALQGPPAQGSPAASPERNAEVDPSSWHRRPAESPERNHAAAGLLQADADRSALVTFGAPMPKPEVLASCFKPAPRFQDALLAAGGEADEPVAPVGGEAGPKSAAELGEEAAFQALKNRAASKKRKVLKKPASGDIGILCDEEEEEGDDDDDDGGDADDDEGGVGGSAIAHVKSTPPGKLAIKAKPAAVPVACKRPAAASGIKVRYTIPPVSKALLKSTTWRIFGSKVFHEVERLAKHADMPTIEARELARRYYKTAGDMWVAAGGRKSHK